MGDMLMQVGRVVYVNYGPCQGRLAVVVDIVDENRILVDGPTTGVDRQVIPAKRIELTKFRINKVMRNQHTDFNRFKAIVLRRQVAKHVRSWVKKNKSK